MLDSLVREVNPLPAAVALDQPVPPALVVALNPDHPSACRTLIIKTETVGPLMEERAARALNHILHRDLIAQSDGTVQ